VKGVLQLLFYFLVFAIGFVNTSYVFGYGFDITGATTSSTQSAYAYASSDAYTNVGARIDVVAPYASISYSQAMGYIHVLHPPS
jgi:hypothetical protein